LIRQDISKETASEGQVFVSRASPTWFSQHGVTVPWIHTNSFAAKSVPDIAAIDNTCQTRACFIDRCLQRIATSSRPGGLFTNSKCIAELRRVGFRTTATRPVCAWNETAGG
jgi:hypothetical protein